MVISTGANILHRGEKEAGKKTFFFLLFLNLNLNLFFVEKLIKISRVGRVTRVGQVTPIKHYFF